MNEQQAGDSLPSKEHHEGSFRPMSDLINAHDRDVDITRGGPHYGEFIEQVRGLMDRVRMSCPTDEQAVETIGLLKQLNDKLDAARVDEWSTPNWTRHDLPGRGNITLPPFIIDSVSRDGVDARITFRAFHLGGNSAAHGGVIAIGFDDLLGMAAAVYAGGVTRTASLTIDYRSVTPLHTELQIRAWTERQEGRKVYVRATLHDGDRLCAEANGLFIVLKPGQP
ncbi:acyl-coenzyme A thioesterase PaaI-like protein [Nocardia tenerifensis]|uniref:Acyl-coenzyme A thioesterase THEM4 n=1 Tax=Nocardia tenerifensis TaxID=228006 RepID=A0A318JWD8_9NOCA|nr:PaaI family thioesterase [Nocardia tenerifensis]PXX58819.1 acyl-coenzyme A thioesterase PaaI-like protein [Nocardia tenerifensis]